MGEPTWLKTLEQARLDKQPDSYIRFDNYEKAEKEWQRQLEEQGREVERLKSSAPEIVSALGEERTARKQAEAEVERLRAEPYRGRETLGTKIPDFWFEAKVQWPWLPQTTEALDDGWRNRTRAENAVWLIEQAEARLREVVDLARRLAADLQQHYGFYDSELLAEARAALAAAQPEEESRG